MNPELKIEQVYMTKIIGKHCPSGSSGIASTLRDSGYYVSRKSLTFLLKRILETELSIKNLFSIIESSGLAKYDIAVRDISLMIVQSRVIEEAEYAFIVSNQGEIAGLLYMEYYG